LNHNHKKQSCKQQTHANNKGYEQKIQIKIVTVSQQYDEDRSNTKKNCSATNKVRWLEIPNRNNDMVAAAYINPFVFLIRLE
jgi:hypothetical protein